MKRNRELQSTRSGLEKGSQPNGRYVYCTCMSTSAVNRYDMFGLMNFLKVYSFK